MNIQEIIIVGAGAAGVSAALGVVKNNVKPLILDFGAVAEKSFDSNKNFYDLRKESNCFDLMIGDDLQGLHNLLYKEKFPPKLISPYTSYISRDSKYLSPIQGKNFKVIQSFAKGGLASGWGAGVYEYNDRDLKGIPVKAKDLKPYYDELTNEIGVSGDIDDLEPYFGKSEFLQKPIRISKKSKKLLDNYRKRKSQLNSKGIYLGNSRLGVLTESINGRSECNYSNLEPWVPNLSYIYNPAFTIDSLADKQKISYKDSILVKSWEQSEGHIVVNAIDTKTKEKVIFRTKKLILAAGTVNTSKIVLSSRKDYSTKLNLVDNPLLQFPIIFLTFIGKRLERLEFGMTNLNIIFDFKDIDLLLQGSIIELNSPARGTFFEMFPFSAKANIRMIRTIAPAAMVMFLYFPSFEENTGTLSLNSDNSLIVNSEPYVFDKHIINRIIKAIYKLRVISHPSIVQKPIPGYAVHYAGTIPMSENPAGNYQCKTNGQLNNEPGVYIADGSLFSAVAAKNITFTIMANSMRIGDLISKSVLN